MAAATATASLREVFSSSVRHVHGWDRKPKFSAALAGVPSAGCPPLGLFLWNRKAASSAVEAASFTLRQGKGRRSSQLPVASVDDAQTEAAVSEVAPEEELEYIGDDSLTIYFKAEGFLADGLKPDVITALEGVDGVSNVQVTVSEGTAVAECTQATTVQATGMAAALVEAIQTAGFQLNTLYLGFDDEAEVDPSYFGFANMRLGDDEGAVKPQ